MNRTAIVPVKSAWASKINWINLIGLGVTVATGLTTALNLDPHTAAEVTASAAAASQIGTIIVRTWFTSTVTPGSAPNQGQ